MSGRGRVSLSQAAAMAGPARAVVLPDTEAAALAEPASAVAPTVVDLDEVAANPVNRRRNFRNLQELGDSMLAAGQVEACAAVTRSAFTRLYPEHEAAIGGAGYVLVAGARRRAAAELVGLPQLRIQVRDDLAESRIVFYAACVAENGDRDDFAPLEEAEAINDLVRECGSGKGAAAQLGKTPAFVSQRLALLRLSAPMKELLRAGSLPIEPARRLSALPPEDQLATWESEQAPRLTAVNRGARPPGERIGQAGRVSFTAKTTPVTMATKLREMFDPEVLEELVRELRAQQEGRDN